ncbi:MAG TPA: group II intron maturase-specific domain-containing protein [Sedimentisphaerales bacterium]|nr:group II intron maturase-specific domain-containing protein [Sedimentisphaerales bacterium]
MRQLAIPTVVDRLIQQALHQGQPGQERGFEALASTIPRLHYDVSQTATPQSSLCERQTPQGKLRDLFRRGRGSNLARFIAELTPILRGWIHYFRLAEVKRVFEEFDGRLRRKLRCMLWRQWKRTYTRAKNLIKRGLDKEHALKSAMNGREPWRNSGASNMHACFPKRYLVLSRCWIICIVCSALYEPPWYGPVCQVVWGTAGAIPPPTRSEHVR